MGPGAAGMFPPAPRGAEGGMRGVPPGAWGCLLPIWGWGYPLGIQGCGVDSRGFVGFWGSVGFFWRDLSKPDFGRG